MGEMSPNLALGAGMCVCVCDCSKKQTHEKTQEMWIKASRIQKLARNLHVSFEPFFQTARILFVKMICFLSVSLLPVFSDIKRHLERRHLGASVAKDWRPKVGRTDGRTDGFLPVKPAALKPA